MIYVILVENTSYKSVKVLPEGYTTLKKAQEEIERKPHVRKFSECVYGDEYQNMYTICEVKVLA